VVQLSDQPPHFRIHGDANTGEVTGWVEGGRAAGTRYYIFPNVSAEELEDWPDDYTVDDTHGWARLIRRSTHELVDEETHEVKGWAF
jgi:hypothetical protein